MALEPCRECGTMVSTEAKACPHCGVPSPTATPDSAAESEGGGRSRGEEVVYEAHVHPVIYFWPFVLTLVFALTMVIEGNPHELRWFFAILSSIAWLAAYVIAMSMDFTVTNRRVMTRTGILHRDSQETLLEKVETVSVYQDLLGRILGYGTVTVVGTGGSHDEFKRISSPHKLRRMLHDQIDAHRNPES